MRAGYTNSQRRSLSDWKTSERISERWNKKAESNPSGDTVLLSALNIIFWHALGREISEPL